MKSTELQNEVIEQLGHVVCPCAQAEGYDSFGLDDMGLVDEIEIEGGEATINLRQTHPACLKTIYIESKVEECVTSIPEIETVTVVFDDGLEWTEEMMSEEFRQEREQRLQEGLSD